DERDDALRDRESRAGEAEQALSAAAFLNGLTNPFVEVVALGEPAQRPSAGRNVVDVAGQRSGKTADLIHERRDEERSDSDDRADCEERRDGRGGASVFQTAALKSVD